jgi:hypothetical protein
MDKPLTAFTTLVKNKYPVFLRKTGLAIVLFPEYLAPRGMVSPEFPFAFFAWLVHGPGKLVIADSVKP